MLVINVFKHLLESWAIKGGTAVIFVNIKMADRKCMLCDPLIDDAFLILNRVKLIFVCYG